MVFISDTHLKEPKLPEGDILIHCGDLTYDGSGEQVNRALKWLGNQDYEEIIVVPGNHDWLFQRNPTFAKELCEKYALTGLVDEFIIFNGLKIYGSPWQPEFCDWAFNAGRTLEQAQTLHLPYINDKWRLIPDDTNILVTHGPPYMMLDYAPQCNHVGCVDLWNRVIQLKDLKIHAFGHIHYSYGVKEFNGVKFINAAICNEQYKAANEPIVIEL